MDAFEKIIGQLLEEENFWVRIGVKVNITKEEKRKIGKPSSPRPEIDIIAFDFKNNILYFLEAKSLIDSNGVDCKDVFCNDNEQKGRYKILTSENYQNIVSKRLHNDWFNKGLINEKTVICFGLIAGKVYKNEEKKLRDYFNEKKWFFWGPTEIKERIEKLANKGYENNEVTITAKLLK